MGNNKPIVLIVDDIPDNITLLGNVLSEKYNIKAATSGKLALKIANGDQKPDIILLDVEMPEMDGYEVCRTLKKDPNTSTIPVIFVTAKNNVDDESFGLNLGAVDYITKPFSPPIIQARVQNHLLIRNYSYDLELKVSARTSELNETRLLIIQRLGRAAEYRDNETGFHVIRMSHYSRLIAEEYSDNRDWTNLIFNAAPMHDVGKIGIPDHILLKPDKLNKDEWDTMKKHSEFGAEIIGEHSNSLLQMSRTIALYHHEKWDGSGYPYRLSGEDIPLEARIVAIADVFDALTSDRPYKKAWSVEDSVKLIEDGKGQHFDPKLVDVFLKTLPELLKIKDKYLE